MINQPEEPPLSIGSAVQFTHKGKQSTDISSKGRAGAASRR